LLVLEIPVASFLSVTTAPGIVAPVVSVMVPVIPAVLTWAVADLDWRTSAAIRKTMRRVLR